MTDPNPLQRLAWLIADPDQLGDVPPEQIPDLLGVLESVRIRLEKRFMSPSLPTVEPVALRQPDRLLDSEEAARRLGVTARWLYDHFDTLPFGKRLADRTLRFSEAGLERWLERKAS